MSIVEKEVVITNKLGLHARAATKLAQMSMLYQSKVTIELDGKTADASSIMGLMLLAGGQGKMVKIVAEGIDAEEALSNITQLINDKFDESE